MRTSFMYLSLVILLLSSISSVMSHMEMKYPPPRLSQYSPLFDYTTIDYDMNAPLNMKGNQICQGKATGPVTATLTAGQTIQSQIVGSAPHGGGHCQWALSYDQGKTFVVIATYLENCPLSTNWAVTIPSTAPAASKAVFAWTWVNAVGNREYYMNCADVTIVNNNAQYASSGTVTGPKLLIVNQPGYPTIPEFMGNPKTGVDLFNARPTITVGLSGSSTPTQPPASSSSSSSSSSTGTTKPSSSSTKSSTGTQQPASSSSSSTATSNPSTPTNPPGSNCICQWAAYCGADSCGVSGTGSACQCSSGQTCGGGPSFQCVKSSTTQPPTSGNGGSTTPSTPSSNCRCAWAGYCGADTCGVTGPGSACQCANGQTCGGAPYFQCRA